MVTPPQLRVATICIDCADADAMADFYGRLLGWDVTTLSRTAARRDEFGR